MSVIAAPEVEALLVGLEDAQGPGTSVLEVGCGRYRHFDYPATMSIAGLDISADQLAQNQYAQEKFLGDAQTYQLDREFDAVVSIFLLEHLDQPAAALHNMWRWTRPGGLLIIAVPNVYSVKGLVTKLSPFWFHHFAYKYIYRREYSIFPTTMRWCIAPRALRRYLPGHTVVHEQYAEEELAPPFAGLYRISLQVLRWLSFGRWRPERSNYLVVVRKDD
jgi:SAM-dependent methyltransferase